MKSFFKLFLAPILILGFLSFAFVNKNLNSNKNNINYQNEEIENYSEYSENSISSQQFIDELESVPDDGTYELQHNVDFSDAENDTVTGIDLDHITIEGNGYTLYNRDVIEIFKTNTFEVNEEHNGLGYYSFFKEFFDVQIFNLNFDNFMFPFGEINDSFLINVNFYNLNYENLIFNVESANIADDYSYQLEDINVNVATIGLIFQTVFRSTITNCCFKNINFSNNQIILFDESISTVIAPIGNVKVESESSYFKNIYINNITFSNNQYISGINNDLFIESSSQQEKYFSIFYSPFIGSTTNNFEIDIKNESIMELDEIIFNNINVSGNNNNFANYTFYSLLPPISTGVTFYGENIYGFNLNLDIQSQLNNNENIGVGNLTSEVYYSSENFYYTGIYQTDWIDDVYYQNIALDYTSFLDDESMVEQIHYNTLNLDNSSYFWYYDKLDVDQDYSFALIDKPMIVYEGNHFYDQNNETMSLSFKLLDGRYNKPSDSNQNVYYSNYTINLINRENNETIWSGYVKYVSERENKFEISIDSELLFENNLYFEISNDYHTWEQDVDFRKYLPEVYNVSNIIDNNNLIVSYDFIDPYNLINSINISLYDNLNNQIENKTIDYNNSEIEDHLNSEQIIFNTKIDDPNNYYLIFDVNCNIHQFGNQNIVIKTLDDNLIQYNENNDIQFREESIIPPDNNESISWWIIFLIVIFALILISIFIFAFYYIQRKNNKKIK